MHYPPPLLKLMTVLKKLPGVGHRSAERFAFQMLDWPENQLQEMAAAISETKKHLANCKRCGCLIDQNHSPSHTHSPCPFCDETQRDPTILCIVTSVRDVYSIEETREFRGLYHVLGGTLSPLEGRGPEHLSIDNLKERLATKKIHEVVIALDSTLEGDATALFLRRELETFPIKLSRLAFGLPMGSSLNYVDGGTLARAMTGRSPI